MIELPDIYLITAIYFPPGPDGELRERGFRESLRSWDKHLSYDGNVILIIINDGMGIRHGFSEWLHSQKTLCHPRNGAGASWNQGFQFGLERSPLVGFLDDDWMLIKPFNLTPWAQMLLEDEAIGAVHLMAPYPGTTGTIEPRRHGWVIRMNRHNLVAGIRACLYHRRFFDAYGWFGEGMSAWESERLYNDHFCQTKGPESVLALPLPWKEGIGAAVELGQKSPRE